MFASIAFGFIIPGLLLCACVPTLIDADFPPTAMNDTEAPITFQEFLWIENPLVLYIQIGLMLAGALGVAALLPSDGDEQTK